MLYILSLVGLGSTNSNCGVPKVAKGLMIGASVISKGAYPWYGNIVFYI